MTELFINTLNMSISASWLIVAVLIFRLFLKKAPRWVNTLLWGIVAIRLISPFFLESALSLIPSTEVISPSVLLETPEITTGFTGIDDTLNPIIEESQIEKGPEKSGNALKILLRFSSHIWGIGVVLLLVYTVLSYWYLKRSVRTAVHFKDNIFQSENVSSPFVLGILKPCIYLPFHISEQSMLHILAHEQAHIQRKDHWWKPLGFLLLSVHWFNPFMWLSYILLCRDIELACDEKVVKDWNTEERADYSAALLSCSVRRYRISACPVAFGEVSPKTRIKSVLHYKKPGFWVVLIALMLCIVIAVCFLTNPVDSSQEADLSFLNYKNATSLVRDREEVRAIYCPLSPKGSDHEIKVGIVSGSQLAQYLDSCDWKKVKEPRTPLSSPGSVEFIIEDEYRITVYERKNWSFRRYVKVSYREDACFYAAERSDYDTAVELLYRYLEKEGEIAKDQYYSYHLLIGAENITKIQVRTPEETITQRNVLGAKFTLGERVHLKALDGIADLRGISITAFDTKGEIVYGFSIPENATNQEIVSAVAADGWLLAPTVAIGAQSDGKYYHIISAEGVAELQISGKDFDGGCTNADGSLFKNGEKVWLEPLDGIQNVEDVSVKALDKDGNVIYGFLLVPNASGRRTMNAKLLEIQDGYFLVEPEQDSWEGTGTDIIRVPMENMDPSPEPKVGDMLQIEYDGNLIETDPGQLDWVYGITVIAYQAEEGVILPTAEWIDGIAFAELAPNQEKISDYEILLNKDLNSVQFNITWSRTGLTLEYGLRSSDGVEYSSAHTGGHASGQIDKIPAGTYCLFVRNTDYTGVPAYDNPELFPGIGFNATGAINIRIP